MPHEQLFHSLSCVIILVQEKGMVCMTSPIHCSSQVVEAMHERAGLAIIMILATNKVHRNVLQKQYY